jgi:RNA polymerase sigma-70 factor, ECF subfamily
MVGIPTGPLSHAEADLSSSNTASLSALLLRFGRTIAPSSGESARDTVRVEYASCADEDLLVLVQSGDREALGVLFDRYARLVFSVGLRVIRDTAEAEDLVHDVFLFILDSSRLFDPARGSARGWLARVTHHRALDRRKYLTRRSFYDTNTNEFFLEQETSCGSDHPEFSYWKSCLKRAFDDLSDEQRATLRLHFFEGFTINEIGKHLGQSPANVRNYYYRGLERLRNLMARERRQDENATRI